MNELGELEAHHADFDRRNTRLVVVSLEGRPDAEKTHADFPHLLVVADQEKQLAEAVDLIHPGSSPGGKDTAAPTTILIDRQGKVRWLFRPDRYIERLSAAELLGAVAEHLGD